MVTGKHTCANGENCKRNGSVFEANVNKVMFSMGGVPAFWARVDGDVRTHDFMTEPEWVCVHCMRAFKDRNPKAYFVPWHEYQRRRLLQKLTAERAERAKANTLEQATA